LVYLLRKNRAGETRRDEGQEEVKKRRGREGQRLDMNPPAAAFRLCLTSFSLFTLRELHISSLSSKTEEISGPPEFPDANYASAEAASLNFSSFFLLFKVNRLKYVKTHFTVFLCCPEPVHQHRPTAPAACTHL